MVFDVVFISPIKELRDDRPSRPEFLNLIDEHLVLRDDPGGVFVERAQVIRPSVAALPGRSSWHQTGDAEQETYGTRPRTTLIIISRMASMAPGGASSARG
jgi:hypothetical protein